MKMENGKLKIEKEIKKKLIFKIKQKKFVICVKVESRHHH